jgi:hypothetical protein
MNPGPPDGQCAIRIDDVWVIVSLGGPLYPLPKMGRVVGIQTRGAPADELKKRYVGRRAEVFAERVGFPVEGRVLYDETLLTLEGNEKYFVRLVDGGE